MKRLIFLVISLLLLNVHFASAQEDNSSTRQFFVPFNDNYLVETKWMYTYTLHLESNTILHQADDAYQYYMYFKYNYTYQRFLNGELEKNTWQLDGNTLEYEFKNVKNFDVVEINENIMVLEFVQENSTGTYQHHFVKVDDADAPFVKPMNELPLVNVESATGKKKRKKIKKTKRWRFMDWLFGGEDEAEEELVHINVEMYGGGYYGGLDPVIKDFIQVKNDGRVIKEFHSLEQGEIVTKTFISREELELFAEYITENKFFDLERIYDCEDSVCQKRKHQKPKPVPLRLAVTYGNRTKVVTVPIWGRDHRQAIQYVNYPKVIDNVVFAIQKMASRIDKGSVAAKYQF